MADYVVNIRADNLCGKQIACGVEMTADKEAFSEFLITDGAVFTPIYDLSVCEKLCQIVEQL